eukprot:361174-Chlamydomonas_euryale.AAC.10
MHAGGVVVLFWRPGLGQYGHHTVMFAANLRSADAHVHAYTATLRLQPHQRWRAATDVQGHLGHGPAGDRCRNARGAGECRGAPPAAPVLLHWEGAPVALVHYPCTAPVLYCSCTAPEWIG